MASYIVKCTVTSKVEYSLTELGESLRPMILLMMEWATHNMEKVLESTKNNRKEL